MPTNLHIDYWAVLICSLLNIPLGMLWFSRPLFGKAWMEFVLSKTNGAPLPANKSMGPMYLLAFFGSLLLSWVMAYIVAAFGAQSFMEGMQVGFMVWLGFAVPLLLNSVLWENKPWKIYFIGLGHLLVYFHLIGGILAAVR